MVLALTAKWTARDGVEEEVHEIILRLAEASRAEPGNLFYQPHRDPADGRVFFFYEQYADQAAYEAHYESEHVRELAMEAAFPLLADRERAIYEPLTPRDSGVRSAPQ